MSRGSHGLRGMSAPALLSLLCAAAFTPLLQVGSVITGAMAVTGIGILSSLGGNVLSGVIVEAVEHLRPSGKPGTGSPDDLERELSRRIEAALAVGDSNARALSAEIAAVFKKIDAGETMLQAAMEGRRRCRQGHHRCNRLAGWRCNRHAISCR